MKAKLHNRFDFEIYDTATGETQYAKAENIILDQLWNRLARGMYYFDYIGVGQGTGELSPTRSSLFSRIASKAAEDVETVYDTDYTAHRTRFVTFTESQAIGTWTEVGIADGSRANDFVTHAFITDEFGNQMTIEKTDTKIVSILATVYVELLPAVSGQYVPGWEKSNPILSSLLNVIGGDIGYSRCYFTALLNADGTPSWAGVFAGANASWVADETNKRRYVTARLAPADGENANARRVIRGILFGKAGVRQIGGVTIPSALFSGKTFTQAVIGEGNGAETQFDFPWPFVRPESETIYIDGVPQTRGIDYTVRYGMRGADTLLVDMEDNSIPICDGTFEEVVALPQIEGEECDITAIELKNGSSFSNRIRSVNIQLSIDGEAWVDAGSKSNWSVNEVITLNTFPPAKYKYMKIHLYGTSALDYALSSYIRIYATPPDTKHIVFTNPPQAGADITADFSIDYLPRSGDFAIDVQAEIQFGEEE
jgi:hypothetical protein